MASKMDNFQISLLKQFVDLCKQKPDLIHTPQLKFFKDWLESLGVNIPPPPETPKEPEPKKSEEAEPAEKDEAKEDAAPESEPMDDESEESDVEIDREGCIDPDNDEAQQMGDSSVEVTDEMREESNQKRMEAMTNMNQGNHEEAIKLFTEAILKNPSANIYAKRARCFIHMEKPNAAIRDCDEAIKINADSAQPYKWRGRAHRLLGHWMDSSKDLGMACRLDYDDEANEWLKEVTPKAHLITEHQRKYERKREEKEEREKMERIKRAREAQEKARKEEEERKKQQDEMPGGFPGGFPGGAGGFPGGAAGFPGGTAAGGATPNLNDLLSDPEVLAAFQDPEVMAAFQDVSQNPANMSKYENNPKIKSIIDKLSKKFGNVESGPPPGSGGGFPGGFSGGFPGGMDFGNMFGGK
ncbi:hsc70-interacting protein-like [Acropora palmata]|uniref:hsc70-interacting protein-like n=1 Tax=Acropora palmata TaxID=6131 RepID=UPI003DA17DF6